MSIKTLTSGTEYAVPSTTKHKHRLDKSVYQQADVVWGLASIPKLERTPQDNLDLEVALQMLAMLTDQPRHKEQRTT